MSTLTWWRLHWSDLPPFNADNAWSRPWGEYGEDVPLRGYSATPTAEDLVRYFVHHAGSIDDYAPIVFFEGIAVGVGPDGEDLVVPTRVIAWFWGYQLDEGILEHEGDPVKMKQIVRRLGSRRRLRYKPD